MRRTLFCLTLAVISTCLLSCARSTHSQPPDSRIERARAIVSLLAKGDYKAVEDRFDDTMRQAFPEDKLRQVWEQITAQVGEFTKQGDARIDRMQGFDAVFVTCEFRKAKLDIQVTLDSDGKVGGLFIRPHQVPVSEYKPPSYARPGSYRQREVTVGSGEWALPGTLTLPSGNGPFPVVVLVHGSGPNDRDETLAANKPFRDLAWGLAGEGVATLRYEKRTRQHAARMEPLASSLTVKEETIDDAIAAVAFLRKTPEVDQKRIFVLGHSLGGYLIPRIAARDAKTAGFIVMAGSTRPLEDAILDQNRYFLSLQPSVSAADKKGLAELEKQVARVKSLSRSTASQEPILGVLPSYWLDLKGYDPAKQARSITRPILILQGKRDYQVTTRDYDGWRNALSGKPNVTFRLYPALNHLFIAGKGKSMPQEYERPGHVSKQVIDDIASWIRRGSAAK